jgi:hypothetical protein
MFTENLENLMNAVIEQAADDFRLAYRVLQRNPADRDAWEMMLDVESFFLSEQFELLTNLDGIMILAGLVREMQQ